MGFSSSKSTNKPIYASQLTGAAGDLTSAYKTTAPKVQQVTDQITGLIPDMLAKYKAGDAGVNAARDYITTTLGGDGSNPQLDNIIGQTNDHVRNDLQAKLGTRGLTGGSAYYDMIGRGLAQNESNLRYTDWNNEQARMAQAAGLAPGIAAADAIQIAPLLGVADTASDPLKAAAGYASGMGGLLGQYQKTKTSQPWGSALLSGLSNAAAAYAGG